MITRVVRVRGVGIAVVLVATHVVHAVPLVSQQPPELTPYRAPVIALVQPASGGTIPQDRPVVVFRFAPGEPGDPLDAASFRVAVDAVDETARFQVAATEAWGAIGPAAADPRAIAPGPHQIAARICSTRGACASLDATVTVLPPRTAADSSGIKKPGRRERVLDALLAAVKRLLQQP